MATAPLAGIPTPLPGLLEDRVAIITGASRGIGAAAARTFAACGAAVALAARDERALAAVAASICADGGKAIAVPADIGDPAAVERLVEQVTARFGRLDAAFNNAGGSGHLPAPLATVPNEEFAATLEINLRGTFLCMKYEIPAMLAAGGGAIVNMASTAGERGVYGLAAYSASKHGVIGLTRTAALDYAAQGIRVNAVAPGPILSERLAALSEEPRARVAQAVPMRRIGLPEEVAAAVAWLCSDQAAFITGATLPIDGGRLASGA